MIIEKKTNKQCPGIEREDYEIWIYDDKIYDCDIKPRVIGIVNDTSIHSSLCTNSICTQAHRCKFCKNFLRKLKEWKKTRTTVDQDLVSSKFLCRETYVSSKASARTN